MIEARYMAIAKRREHYSLMTTRQKLWAALHGFIGCVIIASLMVLVLINVALGCNRAEPEYCFVIHKAWEAGL